MQGPAGLKKKKTPPNFQRENPCRELQSTKKKKERKWERESEERELTRHLGLVSVEGVSAEGEVEMSPAEGGQMMRRGSTRRGRNRIVQPDPLEVFFNPEAS